MMVVVMTYSMMVMTYSMVVMTYSMVVALGRRKEEAKWREESEKCLLLCVEKLSNNKMQSGETMCVRARTHAIRACARHRQS